MRMPIVAIVDIVASRELTSRDREKLVSRIESLVNEFNDKWRSELVAKGAITGGDSVEITSKSWIPIIHLLHSLLLINNMFRVGIGAGKITLIREYADQCDGPAFWKAREAMNAAKSQDLPIIFSIDKTASRQEGEDVKKLVLAYTLLLKMSSSQRKYCFDYIWENKKITEIARKYGTSKSNISISIKKSLCRSLKIVILNDLKNWEY